MVYKSSLRNVKGELFGIVKHPNDATVVLIPVPLEIVGLEDSGTASAPERILQQSCHVSLFADKDLEATTLACAMLPIPYDIKMIGEQLHHQRERIIDSPYGMYRSSNAEAIRIIDRQLSKINEYIKKKTLRFLNQGKIVGLVGGECSSALGCIEAMAEHYGSFGILHIGAQPNLHKHYDGFSYSYASVMYNACKINEVEKIVQVGLRDYCQEDQRVMNEQGDRIVPFFDYNIKQALFEGKTWQSITDSIVAELPKQVYLRFDINGLDAKLCPNTSRPVPGGLEIEQVIYLLEAIVKAGKVVIGFDLCEIGHGESSDWDALVGGHLLRQLSILAAKSQGRLSVPSF
jgi:agmatinase